MVLFPQRVILRRCHNRLLRHTGTLRASPIQPLRLAHRIALSDIRSFLYRRSERNTGNNHCTPDSASLIAIRSLVVRFCSVSLAAGLHCKSADLCMYAASMDTYSSMASLQNDCTDVSYQPERHWVPVYRLCSCDLFSDVILLAVLTVNDGFIIYCGTCFHPFQ